MAVHYAFAFCLCVVKALVLVCCKHDIWTKTNYSKALTWYHNLPAYRVYIICIMPSPFDKLPNSALSWYHLVSGLLL